VRAHWGIKNRLHWVLDVVFRDDFAHLQTGHGPQNMAVVKHFTVTLVHATKPITSLKNHRKLAG
jgi:predicted transposase YbfD/YdcC